MPMAEGGLAVELVPGRSAMTASWLCSRSMSTQALILAPLMPPVRERTMAPAFFDLVAPEILRSSSWTSSRAWRPQRW